MSGFNVRAIVFVGIALFLAGNLPAQTYYWTEENGTERSTSKLEHVPPTARKKMRCVSDVVAILAGDRIEIEGGQMVRMIGVDAPDIDSAVNADIVDLSREKLAEILPLGRVTLTFDDDLKDETGDLLAYVQDAKGKDVNEAILMSGWARCAIKLPNIAQETKLRAAARAARDAGSGLWSNPKPAPVAKKDEGRFRRGFSLGMYARDGKFDYTPFLREMKDIGVTDVMLITPWFLEDWESIRIYRRTYRSSPAFVIEKVAHTARDMGMNVMLMPIVLLTTSDKNHWRGNIAPTDLSDWFSSYNEFIGAFADIARTAGCESLVVGSELSSLEKYEDHWRNAIKNVRDRFGGLLTYSANWDHIDYITFWDDLDMIGMTGYHTLTSKNDPTVDELTAGWNRIREKLVEELEKEKNHKKPYFFTEMGYASLDSINTNPWDYVKPKTVDMQEQADCYESWFRAWKDQKGGFRGAYFYTWWRNSDTDDEKGYTIYGKPAEETVRKWWKKP